MQLVFPNYDRRIILNRAIVFMESPVASHSCTFRTLFSIFLSS